MDNIDTTDTTEAVEIIDTITLLIADDHRVLAEGLRGLIEAQPDMQVCACVQNGHEAVLQAVALKPDVILVDHSMPIMNGTDAIRVIRERCPSARVIMLSMHTNQVHVLRALE